MSGSNLSGTRIFSEYPQWTCLQLKTRLRALGVRFTSKYRKPELINLLVSYDNNNNNEDNQDFRAHAENDDDDQELDNNEELDNDDDDQELDNDDDDDDDQEYPEVCEETLQFLFVRQMQRAGWDSEQIVDFLDEVF